jgi:hypothetical protein
MFRCNGHSFFDDIKLVPGGVTLGAKDKFEEMKEERDTLLQVNRDQEQEICYLRQQNEDLKRLLKEKAPQYDVNSPYPEPDAFPQSVGSPQPASFSCMFNTFRSSMEHST